MQLRTLFLATLAATGALASPVDLKTPAAAPEPLSRLVDYEPAWSPDGAILAFVSNRNGALKVWTMRVDGAEPRQLTHGATEDDSPAWSPDGTRIAYVSVVDGDHEIFVMQADGREPARITRSKGLDIHPHWSPDGSRILFNSSRNSPDTANPTVLELFTMNPDGTGVRPLTRGGIATYASWSPDGDRILLRRQLEDGNSEVAVMLADGTGETNLTRHPAFDGWPAWSPDGRRIAFAREVADDGATVLVMNENGSGMRTLFDLPGRSTNPRWSPDGSRIVFSRRADRQIRLYLVDVP